MSRNVLPCLLDKTKDTVVVPSGNLICFQRVVGRFDPKSKLNKERIYSNDIDE